MNKRAESSVDDFEIDLFDLTHHIYNMRYPMIVGAFITSVFYLVFVFLIQIPKTKIELTVDIDPASLPAITDDKEIAKTLENIFSDQTLINKTYGELQHKYPEIMKKFATPNELMGLIPSPLNDAGKIQFLKQRGAQFTFEFVANFSSKWPSGFFIDLLNSTITKYNYKRKSVIQTQNENELLNFQNILTNIREKSSPYKKSWQKQLTDIQMELTHLEFELFNKLEKNSGKTTEELKQYRKEVYSNNNKDPKKSQETFSEEIRLKLIRMATALASTGAITKMDLNKLSKKIVESRFLEDQIKTNFEIENSAQSGAQNRFTEAYSKKSIGVIPEKELAPLFTASKNQYLSTTRVNGFHIFAMLAAFIGGMILGLGFGLIRNQRKAITPNLP